MLVHVDLREIVYIFPLLKDPDLKRVGYCWWEIWLKNHQEILIWSCCQKDFDQIVDLVRLAVPGLWFVCSWFYYWSRSTKIGFCQIELVGSSSNANHWDFIFFFKGENRLDTQSVFLGLTTFVFHCGFGWVACSSKGNISTESDDYNSSIDVFPYVNDPNQTKLVFQLPI